MEELAVDFRALEDGEQALRVAVDVIDRELHELERLLQPLVATWHGQAAERYRTAQHEWDAAAASMREELAQLHQLVVLAHGNHADAVRVSQAIWAV